MPLHDWTERGLRDWAAADFKRALADPTITYRLIGQHYTNDAAFYPRSCDLMLVGHGHGVATLQSSPYYIYMDGPTFRYGMTGFLNFKRLPQGWSCDQTTAPRDTAKDVWPLFAAEGKIKKVRADQPDPMNVMADSISITNELPENFYDGRVRFIRPKGAYSVHHGTVLSQYDFDRATKTAVLVKVNIPANGSITVSLNPAATAKTF